MDRTGHNGSRRRGVASGFSLIELLLVLVILTALAAIVVPKFAGRTEQANVVSAGTQISIFEEALDVFEVDCGRYPTTEEGLNALVEQPPSIKKRWRSGGYLKRSVPKDPWGNPYQYRSPGVNNPSHYDLYSFGRDGREGGGDDIDNWSDK